MGFAGDIGVGGVAVAILAGMVLVGLRGGENRSGPSARASPGAGAPRLAPAPPTVPEMAPRPLGWFWGPDSRFGSLPGVVRTRVGYAGGTTQNPAYHNLGDHAESIEVVYDPSRISYEKLLAVFWASHDPAERPWRRQYMSGIFYHNDEQKGLAERTRDREASRIGRPAHTEILPASLFTPAQHYHP